MDRGPVLRARASETPLDVDARTTITHALARTGSPLPGREDLHEKVRLPIAGTRFLFVVDASGSHAARDRMRLVKGAVRALLDASARRHDEVAVIAFRGSSASLVLEPTTCRDAAERALAYLPTGGRTPLAHGLELAGRYVNGRTVLVLLTDGRANVPLTSDDAWADALAAAAALLCPALVIDSESGPHAIGQSRVLADTMHATYLPLDGLGDEEIVRLCTATSMADRQRFF
jgi:magnesium chelatase subunit D